MWWEEKKKIIWIWEILATPPYHCSGMCQSLLSLCCMYTIVVSHHICHTIITFYQILFIIIPRHIYHYIDHRAQNNNGCSHLPASPLHVLEHSIAFPAQSAKQKKTAVETRRNSIVTQDGSIHVAAPIRQHLQACRCWQHVEENQTRRGCLVRHGQKRTCVDCTGTRPGAGHQLHSVPKGREKISGSQRKISLLATFASKG